MNTLSKHLQGKVQWKDLTKLSFREVVIENTVTIPWIILSLSLARLQWYLPALVCSFMLFLAALRQAHNGFHYTLGISRKWTNWSLHALSALMLSSMHAVKFNHLRHHKFCLGPEDVEGRSAKMKAIQAILYGPVHIFKMHQLALTKGNGMVKKHVMLDLLLVLLFVSFVLASQIKILQFHLIAMFIGECFSAFFAVWSVHHNCDEWMFARTLRNSWMNKLSYNMFFHLEHHLYPKVPTIKLPDLAERIDAVDPHLKLKTII